MAYPSDPRPHYARLGITYWNFDLGFDAETDKKVGFHFNRKHFNHKNLLLPGTAISADNFICIDIDGDDEGCTTMRALCEPVAVAVDRSRKGPRYYFKSDPRIFTQTKIRGYDVDVLTKNKGQKNSQIVIVAPSHYPYGFEEFHYTWIKPLPASLDDLSALPEEIIEYILYEPPPPPVVKDSRDSEIDEAESSINELTLEDSLPSQPETSTIEYVKKLCDCLPVEFLSNYSKWISLALALKHTSNSPAMKALFLSVSQRAEKYNTETHKKQNEVIWNGLKPTRITLASIKHWAKKYNPVEFFRIQKSDYWFNLQTCNAGTLCDAFCSEMAGDLIYSQSQKTYYYYKPEDGLWRQSMMNAEIHNLFLETMRDLFRRLLADTNRLEDGDEKAMKITILKKAKNTLTDSKIVSLTSTYLQPKCSIGSDPALYFNMMDDYYPLQNGVWKFSESKLVEYDRNHFFTFKIPIPYNPHATTFVIEKCVAEWFANDLAVADFIQYYIGYCLTTQTTRQDFLIVLGSKAGNGKSLLWGQIMDLLLGVDARNRERAEDTYFARLSSGVFLNPNPAGNNDEIYNLNGKRFAFLSEPANSKTLKINQEMIKALTGDSTMTASAKYKNPITFANRAKMALACNEVPEMNFQDNGLYRRALILTQNVSFLPKDEYAREPESLKKSGDVRLRDDNLWENTLLPNADGIMLWALRGATRYFKNPSFPPPESITLAKMKVRNDTDALGNWMRSTLVDYRLMADADRPADWAKRKVTLTELLDIQRDENAGKPKFTALAMRKWAEENRYECGGNVGKGNAFIRGASIYTPPAESESD
jgi:hypothetical protein